MAKRKRLTPAQTDYLEPAPETKGLFPMGVARTGRPPIAQVAGEAATASALEELTEMVAEARTDGRLLQRIPLEEIAADYLVRDRMTVAEEDLDTLIRSLRARGQQTPVELVDLGQGQAPRYGLISGWRRLAALTRLAEEDPGFATVLAVIRAPETASEAYVAMVEENEIRVGLSFYERARIVVKALEQGVYDSPKAALNGLFGNVSRAKRSKIKSFMTLVTALDGSLRHPTAIGERLGLALAKHLEDLAEVEAVRVALATAGAGDPDTERACLEAALAAAERATALDPGTPAVHDTTDPLPPPVDLHHEGDRITLTGPGVDAALAKALTTWLARRNG